MKEAGLHIELANPSAAFEPGAECVGKVSWEGTEVPESAEIRLIWKIDSDGPDDYGLALTHPLDHPQTREARGFRIQLPEGPYSLHGKILQLSWYLELVVKPYRNVARANLVIAPGAVPLELEEIKEKADFNLMSFMSGNNEAK